MQEEKKHISKNHGKGTKDRYARCPNSETVGDSDRSFLLVSKRQRICACNRELDQILQAPTVQRILERDDEAFSEFFYGDSNTCSRRRNKSTHPCEMDPSPSPGHKQNVHHGRQSTYFSARLLAGSIVHVIFTIFGSGHQSPLFNRRHCRDAHLLNLCVAGKFGKRGIFRNWIACLAWFPRNYRDPNLN